MGKVEATPKAKIKLSLFTDNLKAVLRAGLKARGIDDVKVFTEPLPRTKLLRVLVTSDKFSSLRQTERQDLIWRIASNSLAYEDQMRISMILTLTPHEVVGKWPLKKKI